MFKLEGLLVKSNDDIPLLIESRAALFLSKFACKANMIYMSPDIYSVLLKQHYSAAYAVTAPMSSSFHPLQLWQSTSGSYIVHVVPHTKNFLIVADKTQYDLYLYNNGLPEDLLIAYENQQLNQAIEALLTNEEEKCLQLWVTSCGNAMKKVGSHLGMAISPCVNVLTALFQKTCILLRLG